MRKYTKYTKELLSCLTPQCCSLSELARKLNLSPVGSTLTYLRQRCHKLDVDITHFKGQSHRLGKCGPRIPAANKLVMGRKENGRTKGYLLRAAMIECGVDYKCNICGSLPQWNEKPLTLQVDHKNGQFWDNRVENLRFVCPNCHSQTENWGRKPALKRE